MRYPCSKIGMLLLLGISLQAQVSLPNLIIENVTHTNQNKQYVSPSTIVSPSTPTKPVLINGTSKVDFIAAKEVQLKPGFSASGLTAGGQFHAYIGNSDFEVAIMEPTATPGTVGRYEKLELGLKMPISIKTLINSYLTTGAPGINPFDPEQISVEAIFTGPVTKRVFGFFYKNYTRNLSTTGWDEVATPYDWRIRFAPPELGNYTCTINVMIPGSPTLTVSNINFQCVASGNKGYLEVANSQFLRYNGTKEIFYAVGENVAWPSEWYMSTSQHYADYANYFPQLKAAGGNYARIMMISWGHALEWKTQYAPPAWNWRTKLGDYSDRLPQAWELDNAFDLCKANNLQVTLTLESYLNYDYMSNWSDLHGWGENPYHTILGISQPEDFFTNGAAQRMYQRKLRYIEARWGYSSNLAAYEFFNEIDQACRNMFTENGGPNPDPYLYKNSQTFRENISIWHDIMSSYMRNTLGSNHLLTTSYAGPLKDDDYTFLLPYMDIGSIHYYGLSNENTKGQLNSIKSQRPKIFGEYGCDDTWKELCPRGACIHNNLWSTAFMGGYGAALEWFAKENHSTGTISNFQGVRSFFNLVNLNQTFQSETTVFDGENSSQKIENYCLRSTDKLYIAGWFHNKNHTYETVSSFPCSSGCSCKPKIPFKGNFEIKNLKLGKSYDITWYRAPYSGSVTVYSSGSKKTNIFGKLSINTTDMLQYADGYAYIISRPVNKTDAPAPLLQDTLTCPRDTIYVEGSLDSDPNGTYHYSWNFGNGQTSTLVHPKVYYNSPGTYTVTLVVDKLNGTFETLTQNIVVPNCQVLQALATEIEEQDELSPYNVYPNPSNGTFLLSGKNDEVRSLEIFNVIGESVYKNDIAGNKDVNTPIEINIQNNKPGIYFLRVIMKDNKSNVLKITVE